MGSTRLRPSDSCSRTIGVLACTSSRTPRSSIGTTLTTYPPAGTTGQARRAPSALDVRAQGLAQDGLPQLGAETGQVVEAGPRLGPGLGVALLHPRHDDLLDQPRLAIGRVAVQR